MYPTDERLSMGIQGYLRRVIGNVIPLGNLGTLDLLT